MSISHGCGQHVLACFGARTQDKLLVYLICQRPSPVAVRLKVARTRIDKTSG